MRGESAGVHRLQRSAHPEAAQPTKNEAAIRLLEQWMADESRYDERVWPIVKKAIEENRL